MVIQYVEGKNLYVPNIDDLADMSNVGSLFHSVYKSAAEALSQMTDYSRSATRESHNTIIAFTGERGSGKTSTMLSFAKALKDGGAEKLCKEFEIEHNFNDCNFQVIPTIEPSNLTANESILDVVISRMYTMFRKETEERIRGTHNNAANIENVRELNEKFFETHKAIRALCQNKKERMGNGDSLEDLKYIAAGNRIRDIFAELTELFLSFVLCDERNKSNRKGVFRLVLCIDDLDLNPGMGYDICEDIRKYFDFPEVVVLFSVKMGQLTDIIKRRFYVDFKELIEKDMLSDSVEDMAAKYLDKLIPVNRRCVMPMFNAFTMREVEIEYRRKA